MEAAAAMKAAPVMTAAAAPREAGAHGNEQDQNHEKRDRY
jgi:hypothetical protein